MVKQLIYKSRCHTEITPEMVEEILAHADQFNTKHNITSLLLSSKDVFLHFIEGPPESMDLVYGRICNDRRHTEITTLYTGYADHRTYPDWAIRCYCRRTAAAAGFSDAFIIAEGIMETTPDDRMMNIGAFMKSFCDDFLPETPPDRADFN